jgi:phage-related protein
MFWTVEIADERVAKELRALPVDIQARFKRVVLLIRDNGLAHIPEHYVKHLRASLWELRLKGKDGIARALYVVPMEKRLVVVRVFVKKTQATPKQEIALALRRAREIE